MNLKFGDLRRLYQTNGRSMQNKRKMAVLAGKCGLR